MIKVRWPTIFIDNLPVISWINLGNATLYRIIMFRSKSLPRLFVGVERRGCFLFPLSFLSGDYVAEKLNISLADAYNLADFINTQLGQVKEIQGKYNHKFILLNEPIHHYGEPVSIPIVPEIIDGHGRS